MGLFECGEWYPFPPGFNATTICAFFQLTSPTFSVYLKDFHPCTRIQSTSLHSSRPKPFVLSSYLFPGSTRFCCPFSRHDQSIRTYTVVCDFLPLFLLKGHYISLLQCLLHATFLCMHLGIGIRRLFLIYLGVVVLFALISRFDYHSTGLVVLYFL